MKKILIIFLLVSIGSPVLTGQTPVQLKLVKVKIVFCYAYFYYEIINKANTPIFIIDSMAEYFPEQRIKTSEDLLIVDFMQKLTGNLEMHYYGPVPLKKIPPGESAKLQARSDLGFLATKEEIDRISRFKMKTFYYKSDYPDEVGQVSFKKTKEWRKLVNFSLQNRVSLTSKTLNIKQKMGSCTPKEDSNRKIPVGITNLKVIGMEKIHNRQQQ